MIPCAIGRVKIPSRPSCKKVFFESSFAIPIPFDSSK